MFMLTCLLIATILCFASVGYSFGLAIGSMGDITSIITAGDSLPSPRHLEDNLKTPDEDNSTSPEEEEPVVVSEPVVAFKEKVEEVVGQHLPNLKYTTEMADRAVEPSTWICGKNDMKEGRLDPVTVTNHRPFFAFVHVYKTAGSTIRDFFREYAKICKKSLAIVIRCDGYSDIEACTLKTKVNAPPGIQRINSAILHDHFDILGGHFSFGMADEIFSNATTNPHHTHNRVPQVRHIVFLRQPMTRYVSHILYKAKKEGMGVRDTAEETAEYIKEMIRNFRKQGQYLSTIYTYLLTPEQRAMKYEQEQTKEEVVAHKAQLSIDNLVRYNSIVGMTEMFPHSMKIFEHALGQIATSAREEEQQKDLFSRYIGEEETRNVSNRKGISTGSVMKELSKDDEFMVIFREFSKYEQRIVDFAMDMHQKQYEAVSKSSTV